jgi:hypothetical protein
MRSLSKSSVYWVLALLASLAMGLPQAWSQPSVPGFDVSVYARVPAPAKLSFAPSGDLFVGNNGDSVTIHRVGPGGYPVEAYGDTPLNDPDSVAFDASGGISGTAGSVLVGNIGTGIFAVLPDETTIPVFGPEDGLGNPGYLEFDRTGRLLISDWGTVDSQARLLAATGTALKEISGYFHAAATVDGANRIYGSQIAKISVYTTDGTVLPALVPYDPNGDNFYGLEFGPYDSVWRGDLFTGNEDGNLYRVKPDGTLVIFGSGFSRDGRSDLAFGTDGALYVSDASADVIYRIGTAGAVIELIVDDADPDFQSGDTPWPTSQTIPGGYNTSYRYAPPGNGDRWATWFFTLENPGNCTVSAQWTAYDNRSTAAPYTIVNNDTPIAVSIDQTINGGGFNSLGTYWMEAGPVAVVLTDTQDGYVVADAVKLSCQLSGPVMPMTVDNSDADFSTEGVWGTSTYSTGFVGSDYRYATPGSGGKAATWTFAITQAGDYEISAQWTAYENRSPVAPYTIVNNGTPLGVETVDQTVDGGQFNSLGVYSLEAGTLEVVLTDNVNGYVIADAVQIILK